MRKSRNYWTKEKCQEIALKYNHKSDFQKNDASCYIIAFNQKWLDDICKHMQPKSSIKNRYIYVFEWPNSKVAYIGLTWNMSVRYNRHLFPKLKDSKTVYYQIEKDNQFSFKELEYCDIADASKREIHWSEQYKKEGWVLLNKVKCGNLGGSSSKWTKEKCKIIARQYTTKSDFKKNNSNAYNAAVRQKWINDICLHMTRPIVHNLKWTYENCKAESLNHSTRDEFQKGCGSAYMSSLKNGYLDEFYPLKLQ